MKLWLDSVIIITASAIAPHSGSEMFCTQNGHIFPKRILRNCKSFQSWCSQNSTKHFKSIQKGYIFVHELLLTYSIWKDYNGFLLSEENFPVVLIHFSLQTEAVKRFENVSAGKAVYTNIYITKNVVI